MFNPTIVKSVTFGIYTGVVISNSLGTDDSYFQIYVAKPGENTYLASSDPHGSQEKAMADFTLWARDMDANL